jgi:hypothetical protein
MPPARFLYALGMILMLLAIADVALVRFAKIDVTGYRYSSAILGITGIVLVNIARFMPQPPPAGRIRNFNEEEEGEDGDEKR